MPINLLFLADMMKIDPLEAELGKLRQPFDKLLSIGRNQKNEGPRHPPCYELRRGLKHLGDSRSQQIAGGKILVRH